MNDAPQTDPNAKPQSSNMRLTILLVVMLGALGLLAYDMLVARPGCQAAHDTVEKMINEQNLSAGNDIKFNTPEDVQKALGRKPSSSETQTTRVVETYNWLAGNPTKKYYIKVVYMLRKGDPQLAGVHINASPEPEMVEEPEVINRGPNPNEDEPGSDDPGSDDPGSDDPGSDDPGSDDPGSDDPGSDDPGTDDPGSE